MKPLRPTRLEDLQPVVLVGGRSTRFGSDKLLAPVNSGSDKQSVLVAQPMNSLREVFGSRVMAVGTCSPLVTELADKHLEDQYPGAGPVGGILTVLDWLKAHSNEHSLIVPCAVFVLAGDLARISSQTVKHLADVALRIHADRSILAVWARTAQPEPCIGVYFLEAIEVLRKGICQKAHAIDDPRCAPSEVTSAPYRSAGLQRLILPECRVEVPIPEVDAVNINFKEDLS